MLNFLRAVAIAGLAATLFAAMTAVAADAYPSRPIRVIVPQSPGGSTDVVARIVTDRLTEALKQNLVVDNRPGAGSLQGTEVAAKAAPDGYTLLVIAASLTITPALQPNLPFDPVRDFAPITQFADLPHIVVVHPGVPAKSLAEFIALLKSKPGTLACGFSGIGTSTHLAIELFQHMSGTRMLLVPYKGGTPAMTALLGGQVQVNFATSSTGLPHIRAGKLRAIGIAGDKRVQVLPEVATLAEQGYANVEAANWYAILAPAKTPREAVERLSEAIRKAMSMPDVREKLLATGADPVAGTPEQLAALLRRDYDKWGRLIREKNITE